MIMKEPAPSLADADDRHTKKVKIREQLFYEHKTGNIESEEVDNMQMESMEVGQDSVDGVSFKDKLLGNNKISNQTPPFIEFELQE